MVVTAPDANILWVGGEIAGSKVMASVPIASGNHNPSLSDTTVLIDWIPWLDARAVLTTELRCCGPAAGPLELALTLGASAREAGDPALQISHLRRSARSIGSSPS